ncbi:MAG: FMN-binding protein [Eubacteriales bacterium]|nr:FMN-binding protein [Eubacteriales bacterium]
MKKKVPFYILGVIAIAGIIFLFTYLKSVNDYKHQVATLQIHEIDLSTIPDGTYVGDCNVDFIYAKIEVTVKNGAISEIDLIQHKNGKGKPAEKIIEIIKKEQSVDVDAVSGATNSSRVIMKAVENALTIRSEK